MLLQQARGNFAAIIMGTPHKLSESGSCGERTNDGMSELCRLGEMRDMEPVRTKQSLEKALPNKMTAGAKTSRRRILAPW